MRELTKGELNSEIDRYFADARTNIGYAQASLKEGLDDPLDLSVIAGLGPISRGRERRYDSMQSSVRSLLTRIVRGAKSIDW